MKALCDEGERDVNHLVAEHRKGLGALGSGQGNRVGHPGY